jgi:very-short-patch-repair endonuclease
MLGAHGGAAPLPPRALASGWEGEGVGGASVARHQEERFDPRIPRARKLRRDMTDAERKLWWHLRRLPIEHSHFRRQATIGPYLADFACHEQRLVIEVDGAQHNQPENVIRDTERSIYLQSQGYRILRFWNNDVLKNIDGVMEAILAEMLQNEASPPPLPPPHRAKMRGGRGTARPSRASNSTEVRTAPGESRVKETRP